MKTTTNNNPIENVLSNIDIALFALYKLGGTNKKIHTEEIAYECFRLAKERFSWSLSKFKNFPDKTTVRYALESAKKQQYGQLVSGRGGKDISGEREGWKLTPAGVQWIKNNEERIAHILNQEISQGPKIEAQRFIKRIKGEASFSIFQKDNNLNNISRYNIIDMLRCSPDAPIEIIKQKFEGLRIAAELINDKEIIDFLNQCKNKFPQIFNNLNE